MLPAFKEVVEELFVRGLVKAVFATETLALGINMPARCVVLERLVKFNGEAHVDLTPGEYTQLTGRAGRRGIDVEGHAVVVWSPEVDPRHVAGLASTRTYPLRSSFRPSYNMAVNLVGSVGTDAARELLESSFAQFQADRSVVGIARQVQRNEETLAAHANEMSCDRWRLRRVLRDPAAHRDREKALARQGAAAAPCGRRRLAGPAAGGRRDPRARSGAGPGLAVVLDPDSGRRPVRRSRGRWCSPRTAGPAGSAPGSSPPRSMCLTRVRVPKHFNHRSPQERRDLAATLRAAAAEPQRRPPGRPGARGSGEDAELIELRRELRRHPCHACPDREEHARWAERRARLERDTEALREKVANRTGSLARTFDRICELLQTRGYLVPTVR